MLIADGFALGRAIQTADDVQRQVVALVEAGLSFVQLRDHAASDELFSTSARELVEHIRSIYSEIVVSVNSKVDVADELCCGLHFGRRAAESVSATARLHSSLPLRHPLERGTVESPLQGSTRAPRGGGVLLQNAIEASGGRGLPLGFSAHSLEGIQHAATNDFDYATVSPIFRTTTHPESPPIGLEELSKACVAVADFPVFALGGIAPGRVQDCLDAGAYGVAVLSDLLDIADPVERLELYREAGVL